MPSWLRGDTGPFGDKAKKLTSLLAVLVLNRVCLVLWPSDCYNNSGNYNSTYHFLSFRSMLALVVILTFSTSLVLEIWSRKMKSNGRHEGISNMVNDTKETSLSFGMLIQLMLFAVGNAVCEEAEFRGLFFNELESTGLYSVATSNVIQSFSFGMAHWYGVPSGATGVLLTFVYGLVMGLLRIFGSGGMFLPILCHAIADLFIFVVVARKKFV